MMNESGAPPPRLPTVQVLFTGGTIAETYDSQRRGSITTLNATDVMALIPEASRVADISLESLFNLGSADVTANHWLRMAHRCNELINSNAVQGVVVVHGTDTLEESAFFVDLTVKKGVPVVFTGAMRPASHPQADGPQNILHALHVATCPVAADMGTLVVIGGSILPARDAMKCTTQSLQAFSSPNFGPLGTVDEYGVKFYRRPFTQQTLPLNHLMERLRVEIVMHYAGADGLIIRSILDQGNIDGLVVAGTGVGNVGEKMFNAIAEARRKGIPVVMSTRVPGGYVAASHAAKGRGISLQEIGVVLSASLSPQKARILLMVAIGEANGTDSLQKLFDGYSAC